MTELITICICTKDRPASFVRLMQSILISSAEYTRRFTILVIDASLAQGTAKAVEGFRKRQTAVRITYRHVDVLSTSYSRNVGITESKTPFVAYLDDDVTVNPAWMQSLMAILKKKNNHDVMFGAIVPIAGVVGMRRLMFDFILTHTPWVFAANAGHKKVMQPYSANLVIRRTAFARTGMFNTVLGVSDPRHFHPRGEDAEWFMRARRMGLKPMFVSDMTVNHYIDSERVEPHSLFRRFIEDGKNRVLFVYYENTRWDIGRNQLIVRVIISEVMDVYKRIIFRPASLSPDSPILSVLMVWLYMNALYLMGEVMGVIGMNYLLIRDKQYYADGRKRS